MSFGDKKLDKAYDDWATQSPDYYEEDVDEDEELEKKKERNRKNLESWLHEPNT